MGVCFVEKMGDVSERLYTVWQWEVSRTVKTSEAEIEATS